MDSERVNEIRAALDEYDLLGEKTFYEISDHDNIRARQIRDDMPDWLRDLLAENERLAKVAAAARALVIEVQLAIDDPEDGIMRGGLWEAHYKAEQALAAGEATE